MGLALIFSGCTASTTTTLTVGTPPSDVTSTLKAIRVSVADAMAKFNVGYKVGRYSDPDQIEVEMLYASFLMADKSAMDRLEKSPLPDAATILAPVTTRAADVIRFVEKLGSH